MKWMRRRRRQVNYQLKNKREKILTHIHGRKDELITCYSGDNGTVLGVEIYSAHEELVPFCCGRAKDCYHFSVSKRLFTGSVQTKIEWGGGGECRVLSLMTLGFCSPPPYAPIRAVRMGSCLSNPRFSTSCWAITSPVEKRI
jgi:hypothetical protein